jgi:prepilin-type N-terminal cleavage/methylation domain-containing protein
MGGEGMKITAGRGWKVAGGFTLIELLVVMGIIGLLVALLLPAVNLAIVAVRSASTQNIIQGTASGLEAYKADWRMYPPSSNAPARMGVVSGQTPQYGFACLAYYLLGPTGKGWGKPAANVSPTGGYATATFGPYYEGETATTASITDAFSPAKNIFYFRFEPTEAAPYNVSDNPTKTADPPDTGFRSQDHLNLRGFGVQRTDASGRTRYVREDYLLISPGPDRLYGYVKENASTQKMEAVLTPPPSAGAYCDDITNFK